MVTAIGPSNVLSIISYKSHYLLEN